MLFLNVSLSFAQESRWQFGPQGGLTYYGRRSAALVDSALITPNTSSERMKQNTFVVGAFGRHAFKAPFSLRAEANYQLRWGEGFLVVDPYDTAFFGLPYTMGYSSFGSTLEVPLLLTLHVKPYLQLMAGLTQQWIFPRKQPYFSDERRAPYVIAVANQLDLTARRRLTTLTIGALAGLGLLQLSVRYQETGNINHPLSYQNRPYDFPGRARSLHFTLGLNVHHLRRKLREES